MEQPFLAAGASARGAPVRRDPFARCVRQGCGEPDQPSRFINRGGLDGCDLVPAKALADQVKAVCEGNVAEASIALAREGRAEDRGARLTQDFRTLERYERRANSRRKRALTALMSSKNS